MSLPFIVPEFVTFATDQSVFLTQLTELYESLAKASNAKDVGIYDLNETINGQTFFGATPQESRDCFRKTFNFGAIVAGGLLPIVHNIAGLVQVTRLYGSCLTAVPDQRPLPYVDTFFLTNQVSILLNGANILIQNGATAPAIASGLIVIEYLKN